ncbi:facilitated trehalose transporter Tret1-like isoform X2 [Danaus plexippus]|nr:facilitated trehalose transporter Tret1-like isoform X2 [Danaus plexippus]
MVNYLFILGLYMGAPIMHILSEANKESSENIITPEMASWFPCTSALSSFPWAIILPLIANRYGRKASFHLVNINTVIGTIIFNYSKTLTQLIISQILIGTLVGSVFTVFVMIISELASPKSRGFILTLISAAFFWGTLTSNFLAKMEARKNIIYIVGFCCIFNAFNFPESPCWLATKNKFEECAKLHRWIKGTDSNAENHLRILISNQKTNLNNTFTKDNKNADNIIGRMRKVLSSKKFYKPLFYTALTICLYYFSGKLTFTIYASDIIKNITKSEEAAYNLMLILNGVTVFCAYVGCYTTCILKRRTQLLVFLASGILFLYLLSIYTYIAKLNIVYENEYIYLILFSGFSISYSCGPLIIGISFLIDLIPTQERNLFLTLTGIIGSLVLTIVLKITPAIYTTYDSHVLFLFYAITASVCLFGLYKHLPESKNRIIQQLENVTAQEEEEEDSLSEGLKEVIPLKSVS